MKQHVKKFSQAMLEERSYEPTEWSDADLLSYIDERLKSLGELSTRVFADTRKRIFRNPEFKGWGENLSARDRRAIRDVNYLDLAVTQSLLTIKRAILARKESSFD